MRWSVATVARASALASNTVTRILLAAGRARDGSESRSGSSLL